MTSQYQTNPKRVNLISKLKSLNDSSKPKAYSRFQGESVQNVARDIAEHFFKNAEAADTAEGITDWWIARQKRSNALPVIRKALNLLVEEGLVNKRTYGSRVIYLTREG